MKHSIEIIAILVVLIQVCAGQQCNDRGMRQFDANMARLVTIGNSGRKFPQSKGGPLNKWCNESDRLVKEMENYKIKCFHGVSKQVFGILIYSVRNAFRLYCRRDSPRLTALIEAVPCVNRNDLIVTKCYTKFIDGVIGAKNAMDTKKIPYMCCEYANIYQCFDMKLTKAPDCSANNVVAISDLLRDIIGNVVDLICGDYTPDSDKCKSLGPPPKKKRSQRRSKSFAPPVLDLLESVA